MSDTDDYDLEGFFGKIEWEGGDFAALEYGLTTVDYDVPAEMSDDWDHICADFEDLQELLSQFDEKWSPNT